MSTTETETFETYRHTGALHRSERIALAELMRASPKPLFAFKAMANVETGDTVGFMRLQARGWLRDRKGYWELTARCHRELEQVAGHDAWTSVPAAVKAGREAALAAAAELMLPIEEQRGHMPSVLAILARHAMEPSLDREQAKADASRFERLLTLVQRHGLTQADTGKFCTALRDGDQATVDALAEEACSRIPLAAFLQALGPVISRLVAQRLDVDIH